MKNRKFPWPTQRRLIQLYAALLHNAHVKGFITGEIYTGNAKFLCVPGLNCYSCPGAVGACPLGALQNAIASSGNRAPAYMLGVLMLMGLTLGRTICGYLCPMGLIQELLHKIPTPKLRKSRATRALSLMKYVILAVFVVAIPLWYAAQNIPVPGFCKYICPAGTLEGAVGLLSHPDNADKFSMLGLLFTNKFVILMVIIAACVFIYRAFCRFLCPLGAIYGLFSKIAVIGVRVEPTRCVDCGKCMACCPVDTRRVGDHECVQCGKCIEACPTGAISMKAGKIVLRGPDLQKAPETQKKRRTARGVAWALALILLVFALWFYNRPQPMPESVGPADAQSTLPPEDDTPVGKEPGMRAPDFTVPLYGGGEFTLSAHRGKPVIVNFWATWCGPCVTELPHFDEIHEQYGEEVAVIAIHSDLVTDDVEKFLSNYDYALSFALDGQGQVIRSFGGSTMLPQTVVIDANGIITYNAVGSVTYEQLELLLKQAEYRTTVGGKSS